MFPPSAFNLIFKEVFPVKPDVTVYVTSTCPFCTMVKRFLTLQNIPYKEVNVEKDPIAMQILINATGQLGVPQTNVNGYWVLGYDPDAIMAALNR